MYFDDFIAAQVMRTSHDQSPSHEMGARRSDRHVLRILWRGIRQFASGVDAYSSVTHGSDVPPDHPARSRPARPPDARDLDRR